MYLIAGLGNPEEEYSRTRHNMGFDVVNQLATKYEIDIMRNKFDGLYGSGIIEGEKVILLKPQIYMNLSGKSIKTFMDFYKIPIQNVLVIYDDMDVEVGQIKIRKKGGPGTHNGAKSVVHELVSEDFPRIRVGIGKPISEYDDATTTTTIDYVIGKLDDKTYQELEQGIDKAVEAISEFIKNGIDSAMNKYN